jgi:hypothetical protein
VLVVSLLYYTVADQPQVSPEIISTWLDSTRGLVDQDLVAMLHIVDVMC